MKTSRTRNFAGRRRLAVILVSMAASLAVSADWDTRFKEVCSYDAYCRRLRTSDGTWLKPKPEIVAVMRDKEIQAQLHEIAKKYSLDATAIASVILAENSLNVGLKDDIQTWLAKKGGITGIGSYRFTFGFGQISIRAASEAERHVAALEGRPAKSDDELTKEITDPMGSIRLAGAILRKVQDDYKAQGFDISKDLSLQATLYNLGQSEERARRAK